MPFKPGQSGNPAGRKKGTGHVQICKDFAEKNGFPKLLALANGPGRRPQKIKFGPGKKDFRIVWAGPSEELQFEALKLALAYGVGKPREQVEMDFKTPTRIVFEPAGDPGQSNRNL